MQPSVECKAQATGWHVKSRRHRVWAALAGLIMMVVGLAQACGADAIPATSPDLHTFTNQDGRTIKAVIFSAAEDYVFLKRDDGQTFKVPVSTLSKGDQGFIRQWIIKQAQAHGDDILTFGIESVKGDSSSHEISTKTKITTAWSEYYKIKVANVTPVNWANLQVHYIIFYSVGVPGALPPGNFTPSHAAGKVAIDSLPGVQNQTVSTEKVDLKEVALGPNVIYSNGAPTKVTDVLQGVWVRVYDENNNLLQEWASPHDLMKNNDWDALSAPPRGARRAAAAN